MRLRRSGGWCAREEVCKLCVHIVRSLRGGHMMKWLGRGVRPWGEGCVLRERGASSGRGVRPRGEGCVLGEKGASLGRGVCGEGACLLSEVHVHGTACSPCARAEVRMSAEMSVLYNEVNVHCVDTSVGTK